MTLNYNSSLYPQIPPSYHSHAVNERDTETATLLPKRPRAPPARQIIFIILGCLCAMLFIGQNLGLISCLLDDVPASEKRAMRRQWRAEQKAHQELGHEWARERTQYEHEMRRSQDKMKEWREEEHRWEEARRDEERHRKEIQHRREGVYWMAPIGDPGCIAFGTRRYRAHLKDIPFGLPWLEVCSDMPITIHGRPIDRPDSCYRDDQDRVWGNWSVTIEEPSCIPYWEHITRLGCAPGKPGMVRYQGRLAGLKAGDDWENMCATTPATVEQDFEYPTSCDNQGFFGMFGIWDIPTTRC